jgi:hypothetical protein
MLPMIPYNIDPSWYESTWYGAAAGATRAQRTSALIRAGLSAVLIVGTVVALRVLGVHAA